jgi:hypothetical protein
MKHIKLFEDFSNKNIDITEIKKNSNEPLIIEGFHGSSSLIKKFNFPLFLTTSKHRGLWFATSMKWNEKLNKNVMHPLKGDEKGYLYNIRIENAILTPWKSGPSDEMLIESGNVTILNVEKIGVKGFTGQYYPYVIGKI